MQVEINSVRTIADIVKIASELRQEAEEAELRFFTFLMAIEREKSDIWKYAGHLTFEGFLQSHSLCNVARYRNVCKASQIFTPEKLDVLGVHAAVAVGKMKSPTLAGLDYVFEAARSFRNVNDTAPSAQTAQKWVEKVDSKIPQVVLHSTKIQTLSAELQAIRAELHEANRKLRLVTIERDKLEKENKKLRSRRNEATNAP